MGGSRDWSLGPIEFTSKPHFKLELQGIRQISRCKPKMLLKTLHRVHNFFSAPDMICVIFTWYRWMLLYCRKWGRGCSRIPVLLERCWGFNCSIRLGCCKLHFFFPEWHWTLEDFSSLFLWGPLLWAPLPKSTFALHYSCCRFIFLV